jgi:hypothetical protein
MVKKTDIGGAAGMLQMTGSAGSIGSKGVETSGDGAGGCAAEGGVPAVGSAAEAVKAKLTGSGTGAGLGRGAHSDEDAPPGAGAGRWDEAAGEEDDSGADGDGGSEGGDEAGGVDDGD